MTVHRVVGDGAGAVVDAKVGDEIVVTLSEMSGAGYQWEFDAALPRSLEVLPEAGGSRASTAPGASTSREIRLRVTAGGQARVELSHRRGWEGAASASRRVSLAVRAT
jgi:predicted secreted protein